MKTTQYQSDELTLVAKIDGDTLAFKAWRHELFGWFSPKRWQGIDSWAVTPGLQLLDRKQSWGPGPGGLVAVDFDKKEAWSYTPFTVLGKTNPPDPHFLPFSRMIEELGRGVSDREQWNEAHVHARAWAEALAMPETWPHGKVRLLSAHPDRPLPRPRPGHLGEFLAAPEFADVTQLDAIQQALTPKHNGVIDWHEKPWIFHEASYLPEGWQLHTQYDKNALLPYLDLREAIKDWAGYSEAAHRLWIIEQAGHIWGIPVAKAYQYADLARIIRDNMETEGQEAFDEGDWEAMGESLKRLENI